MLNINKSINYSASSQLEDGTVVANMTASITNEGIFNMNKYTVSKEAYAENADMISADWEAFETIVEKCAKEEIVIPEVKTEE